MKNTDMLESSIKNRLLAGGAWAFAGKILASLSGLAVNALLAHLISPEEMGAYFLTLSLVSVSSIVAQMGLTKTVVRLVAESMGTGQPARAKQSILWSFRFTVIGAVIMAGIIALGGGQWIGRHVFHSELIIQVMGLAALWAMLLTIQNFLAEVFRGFHDIRLATLFGNLSTSSLSMFMLIGLWFVQRHGELKQVITLIIIAGMGSVVISAIFLVKRLSILPNSPAAITAKDILTISWPLWITGLTLFILTQADLWILGIFRSQDEVAVYGAAARLVALVTMPLFIMNAVVPPFISEMYFQGKKKELEKILRSTATIAGLPALMALGLFIFWGTDILKLVFGDYYRNGGTMLAILSIGQLANVWAGSCGLTLMLTGYQATMMIITVISGIITVTGALLLVHQFGGVGVASAATIGMSLQNLMMLRSARKKTGIWTHVQIGLLPRLMRNKW